MLTRRELLIFGGVAGAAAVAGAMVGALGIQKGSGAAELLATELDDLQGRRRRLVEWQGRVLLCNFWATWCAPCLEEMPLLSEMQRKLGPSGLQVVGIGIDQVAKMQEFSAKRPVSYPLLAGEANTLGLMRRLGSPSGGLPFTCLLDRSGSLVFRKTGALTEPELFAVLKPLLG